jgi:CRISPR/Cas system-associated endonuclease Cas1
VSERELRDQLESVQAAITSLQVRNPLSEVQQQIEENLKIESRLSSHLADAEKRHAALEMAAHSMRTQASRFEQRSFAKPYDPNNAALSLTTALMFGLIIGAICVLLGAVFFEVRRDIGFAPLVVAMLLRTYEQWKLGRSGR